MKVTMLAKKGEKLEHISCNAHLMYASHALTCWFYHIYVAFLIMFKMCSHFNSTENVQSIMNRASITNVTRKLKTNCQFYT
jgi:hypothetical protein